MKKYDTPITHIIVWTGYVTIAILVYGYGNEDWLGTCFETSYSHLISAGVFYFTAQYSFPKLLSKKRFVLFSFSLIFVLLVSILLRFFYIFYIYPEVTGSVNPAANRSLELLIRKFFFQWFTFSLYAFFYWRSTTDRDKARREKLELEIAVLKAQINPHFTMNSLELFRAQSAEVDPKVSDGIGWFMKILRAGIVTPEQDGKISLRIETEAIQGTIFIFKQRFPKIQLEHNLEIEDNDEIRIYPHILLPFVENAFKHGSYADENNKIKVELLVKDGTIKLFVFNKKGNRIKDNSTGIGLRYVKRHLDSGYRDQHSLIINETDETYSVNLSVQLK